MEIINISNTISIDPLVRIEVLSEQAAADIINTAKGDSRINQPPIISTVNKSHRLNIAKPENKKKSNFSKHREYRKAQLLFFCLAFGCYAV